MLALADGTILPIVDYYIKERYSGVNELHFTVAEDLRLVNEQSIRETTQNQNYIVKIINGDNITCELDLDALKSKQADYDKSATPLDHLEPSLASVGWSLIDNTGIKTRRTITGTLTPMDVIGQVEDTWGGITAVFDTANKTVTILCPENNHPQFAFLAEELNLRQVDIAGNSSGLYTRLRAKGANGMTFADINNGKDYVENHSYTDRVIYGAPIDDARFTDPQSLLEYAQATLDAKAVPAISYECDVVDVAAMDGDYNFLELQMHKAIWLLDKKHNSRIAHRVVEYTIYPDNPGKNKVTLSTVLPTLQSAVGRLQASVSDPNSAERKRETSAVEAATRMITGAEGGVIRFLYDGRGRPVELLVMDTDDIATAQKVWRFNIGGFGFSSNGYDGTYSTAITQDGHVVADFVDVGTLTAILIKSLDGRSKWDLSTGEMSLYNTKIQTLAAGHTYTSADYSQTDQDRITKILLHQVTPTLADYEKLDLNNNGEIDAGDGVIIRMIMSGTREVNFTSRWAFKVDPTNGEQLVKVYREFDDHIAGETREAIVLAAGYPRVAVNTIQGDIGIFGEISLGETRVTRKILGYVVEADGGSGNRATCFVPYPITYTRYQCASNDWYCAFVAGETDGKVSFTKSGGTGTIVSTTPIYNF